MESHKTGNIITEQASKQASKQSINQLKQAPLTLTGKKRMYLKHF
ncbi:hypothetical protein P2L54_09235 [Mannheimia haemolytica]|nr:hypothetical protein [Mannheimia haemolytica]